MQWRHSCTHGWHPTIFPSFIVNSMEEEKNGQCGAYLLLLLLSAPSFGDVLKLHLRRISLEEDDGGNALVMRLRRWKKESGLSGWGTFLFKETSFGYNNPLKF